MCAHTYVCVVCVCVCVYTRCAGCHAQSAPPSPAGCPPSRWMVQACVACHAHAPLSIKAGAIPHELHPHHTFTKPPNSLLPSLALYHQHAHFLSLNPNQNNNSSRRLRPPPWHRPQRASPPRRPSCRPRRPPPPPPRSAPGCTGRCCSESRLRPGCLRTSR